ncbi:hypothetical protein C8R45DRAFT_1030013 [Mycena sanguinolenta]|nr:hypothetical protein C8R45DRAFT_1030013 [Mycena sanguinolenta]
MAPVNSSLCISNLFRARRLVALTVLFCPQASFPTNPTCILLWYLATRLKSLDELVAVHQPHTNIFFVATGTSTVPDLFIGELFCYTDPLLY